MTFYEILEVESDATGEQIKEAYKHLATKYHPDKHNGDSYFEKKFKDLNEAYSVLSDTFKRADYDRKLNESKSSNSYKGYDYIEEILKKEREKDAKAKQIVYASEEIVISGLYINANNKSYPISEIDISIISKNQGNRSTWAWVFLIIGIITAIFLVGFLLIAISVFLFLLPQEHLLILVNRDGNTPVLKGSKKDLKILSDLINNQIENAS